MNGLNLLEARRRRVTLSLRRQLGVFSRRGNNKGIIRYVFT